ncbi:MAG: glutamyl-tRNA synthetase [Planctomycetota bacterium]|jgi:glutamyl-tRNA synthetase
MSLTPPVGRLAPSPTGELHLGHARSFLLAWWSIRSRGGRLVMRIEDLDVARAKPDWIDSCRRDLEWLSLDWDGPELLQSTRTDVLQEAVDRLLESGQAYACTCSRREIMQALSAPHAGGELRYPGTCRGKWETPQAAEAATNSAAGVRFLVKPGPVAWRDGLLGERKNDVAAEVGDFLLARRDGNFAYQLAVVVHDALQGVTEVLRGDDLAPSAARQALLQDALGLPRPNWIHVPLVLDATGQRLAKREPGTTLASLREDGVDPRAIVAWAARSSGLECGERALPADVLTEFDLAKLPSGPVRVGHLGRD